MSRTPSSIINFSSFRNEGNEWRRFARMLLIFAGAPLFLAWILTEFFAWEMGESLSFEEVGRRQAQNPDLLFTPFREASIGRYKLVRFAQEKPEIISLGESRGKHFRGAMFAPYTLLQSFVGGIFLSRATRPPPPRAQ